MENKMKKWVIILDTGPVNITGILFHLSDGFLVITDETKENIVFATNQSFQLMQLD